MSELSDNLDKLFEKTITSFEHELGELRERFDGEPLQSAELELVAKYEALLADYLDTVQRDMSRALVGNPRRGEVIKAMREVFAPVRAMLRKTVTDRRQPH